jgi:hypothetical protein
MTNNHGMSERQPRYTRSSGTEAQNNATQANRRAMYTDYPLTGPCQNAIFSAILMQVDGTPDAIRCEDP